MIAQKLEASIIIVMKNFIVIFLGSIVGIIILFCIFFTIARIFSPFDIFGIRGISAESQKDFYEWNKETSKADQQAAFREVLKEFNFVFDDAE